MQVRLIKELYGNQIGELYHSLPCHMIEFVLDDFDWSVSYCDLMQRNREQEVYAQKFIFRFAAK